MPANKIKLKVANEKLRVLAAKENEAIANFTYANISQNSVAVSADNGEILWEADNETYKPEYIGLNIKANTQSMIGWKVHIGVDDSTADENLAWAWSIVMEVAVRYKILSLKVVSPARFLSSTDPQQCGKQITLYCSNQLNECSFLIKDQAYLEQLEKKFNSAKEKLFAKPSQQQLEGADPAAHYSYLRVDNNLYYVSWRENVIEKIGEIPADFPNIAADTILTEQQLIAIKQTTQHTQLDSLPWLTMLREIEHNLRLRGIRPAPLNPGDRAIIGSQYLSVRNDKTERGVYRRASRNYNSENAPDPFVNLNFEPAMPRPAYRYVDHPEINRNTKIYMGNLIIPNDPEITGNLYDAIIYQLNKNQDFERIAIVETIRTNSPANTNFDYIANEIGCKLKIFSSLDENIRECSPNIASNSHNPIQEIPTLILMNIGNYHYPLMPAPAQLAVAETPASKKCCGCVIL